MIQDMHRLAVVAVTVAVAGFLAGCDWARDVGGKINPDSLGLADRCADFMKRAMPFADIDIAQRTSEGAGIRTIVARVEGRRSDLPKDAPGDRDLAVECKFANGVLTGFRWTKGGPPPER
jgi:hypothetical protein